MLKNEISIQHRVASAAFSPVTHVVATAARCIQHPRSEYCTQNAAALRATVGFSGHPMAGTAGTATIRVHLLPRRTHTSLRLRHRSRLSFSYSSLAASITCNFFLRTETRRVTIFTAEVNGGMFHFHVSALGKKLCDRCLDLNNRYV